MKTIKRFSTMFILSAATVIFIQVVNAYQSGGGKEVTARLPTGKRALVRSMELGKSVEGRSIRMHVFGEHGEVVLIFGGIHGDEWMSQYVALCLVDYLLGHDELYENRRVAVIATANPDGLFRLTRENVRGVDCNRNFPTGDWSKHKIRFYPGPKPASEPETRAIMRAVNNLKPVRIVAIHGTLGEIPYCVNFDGPASNLAQAMAKHNGYPVMADMGYPTLGSFGTWAGKEQKIPTITLELRDRKPTPKMWSENRDALIEAIRYDEQTEKKDNISSSLDILRMKRQKEIHEDR
jgi:protein MpaA